MLCCGNFEIRKFNKKLMPENGKKNCLLLLIVDK